MSGCCDHDSGLTFDGKHKCAQDFDLEASTTAHLATLPESQLSAAQFAV